MAASSPTDVYEHFRVLRREDGTLWELGRGAMGVTFKALDTRLDALVALKVIGSGIISKPAAHERFRREARAAASLRHPNVASIHHFGEEKGDFFYAMEFVEGQSVSAAVKAQEPLPWLAALDILRQTTSALVAVHAMHLVHRDIKPDNLMLQCGPDSEDQTRLVKLIDFGLAKSLVGETDAPTDSPTLGFVGTPYYASPEQCAEQECDIRSDLYSLGVTLWFMVAGRPPFRGRLLEVLEQHLRRLPPFGSLPAEVPLSGHHLLGRLLAKRPEDRPQTPAELRREIDVCLRAPEISPSAPSATSVAVPILGADADRTVELAAASALPVTASMMIPVPLSRFFGREKEINVICEWLRDGRRLVTLTGPGGCGKTRLSLEIARWVANTLGRKTFFVPLDDLRDARFLPRRVRDRLLPGAALDGPHVGDDADALLAQISTALSNGPCLLLLDNFEQFSEEGAEFVGLLLERLRDLSCVVTSRHRLDLSGEREFAVSALTVPSGDDGHKSLRELEQIASVRLFCDRAQAVRADFELNPQNAVAIAELCRKVEGLPLAIELAAAWAEVLTPQQIVSRLDQSLNVLVGGKKDVAERHRTLRATLDWSYGLLSAELRLFFARLSVFRGGWTSEGAACVRGEGSDAGETLAQLSALRRYSLILSEQLGDSMRFRMLEPLRQYAGEQLARLGDDEGMLTRRRHRDFYLSLAIQAEPELRKSDQARWLGMLETEHENFRAALARTNDGEPAQLSLAYCLHRFWMIHNHLVEGREWLARALAQHRDGGTEPDPLLAKAYNAAGVLAWAAGDLDAAQADLERCLSIFRALGDQAGTASVLNNLGLAAGERSDFALARARYDASIALYRQMASPTLLAAVLSNLGRSLVKERLYPEARDCLEESLSLQVASADRFNRANILASLGEVEALEGNHAGAYRRFGECLSIREDLGDLNNFEVYWQMAKLAASRGDNLEAARLMGAADAVRNARVLRLSAETAAKFQADHHAMAAVDSIMFRSAWEAGKTMSGHEIALLCHRETA